MTRIDPAGDGNGTHKPLCDPPAEAGAFEEFFFAFQETRLNAGDGLFGNFFTRSVSISGDYPIVGAVGSSAMGEKLRRGLCLRTDYTAPVENLKQTHYGRDATGPFNNSIYSDFRSL